VPTQPNVSRVSVLPLLRDQALFVMLQSLVSEGRHADAAALICVTQYDASDDGVKKASALARRCKVLLREGDFVAQMRAPNQFGVDDRSVWYAEPCVVALCSRSSRVFKLMKALDVVMGADTWCAMMAHYTSVEQPESAVAIFNENFVDGALAPTGRVYEELMTAYLVVRDVENVQVVYQQMRRRGIAPTLACGDVLVRSLLLRDDTLPAAFELVEQIASTNQGRIARRLLQDLLASCARLPKARALSTLQRLLQRYGGDVDEECYSLAINVARFHGDEALEVSLWQAKQELSLELLGSMTAMRDKDI
jgi:hypothetical protein